MRSPGKMWDSIKQMKDIRKKVLGCKPCEEEHKAGRSTAQQLMPVMDNSVSCDQAGQLHWEFGVYGSHMKGASRDTAVVSGKQTGCRTEHSDVVRPCCHLSC